MKTDKKKVPNSGQGEDLQNSLPKDYTYPASPSNPSRIADELRRSRKDADGGKEDEERRKKEILPPERLAKPVSYRKTYNDISEAHREIEALSHDSGISYTLKVTIDFVAATVEEQTLAQALGATVATDAVSPTPTVAVPRLKNGQPALWKNKEVRQGMSPIKFLETHYGIRKREDGTWDNRNITRKIIGKIDFPLYEALATWISRHPEDNFDGKPRSTRKRVSKPIDAKARRREVSRESSSTYRAKRMSEL